MKNIFFLPNQFINFYKYILFYFFLQSYIHFSKYRLQKKNAITVKLFNSPEKFWVWYVIVIHKHIENSLRFVYLQIRKIRKIVKL